MTRHARPLIVLVALGGCGDQPASQSPQDPVQRNAAGRTPAVQTPVNTSTGNPEPAPREESAALLDARGLRAVEAELGTAGSLAFGTSADLTVEAMSRIIGANPAEDTTTAGCGPVPTRVVHWTTGFSLVARGGRFAGWAVDRPGYSFANGIGVGTTLRELGQAFPVSLNRRAAEVGFTVNNSDGAVGGTLAGLRGDARVLTLHAGATCDPQAQPVVPPPPANAAAARRR